MDKAFPYGKTTAGWSGRNFSTWARILSGVPQGSVLGPVLFVCFINDMPEAVRSVIYLYADDIQIFREVNSEEDTIALQRDLDQLVQWEHMWQLRFNVDKCKVMHLGGERNLQACYSLKTEVLGKSKLEKDLGI